MKKFEKGLLITVCVLFAAVAVYAAFQKMGEYSWQRMISISEGRNAQHKFAQKAGFCLSYEGNVYYAVKKQAFHGDSDKGPEAWASGYEYKGMLKAEYFEWYGTHEQFMHFKNTTMTYRNYTEDDTWYPRDHSSNLVLQLYYQKETDSCLVWYKSQGKTGLVWCQRDDDRFSHKLIPGREESTSLHAVELLPREGLKAELLREVFLKKGLFSAAVKDTYTLTNEGGSAIEVPFSYQYYLGDRKVAQAELSWSVEGEALPAVPRLSEGGKSLIWEGAVNLEPGETKRLELSRKQVFMVASKGILKEAEVWMTAPATGWQNGMLQFYFEGWEPEERSVYWNDRKLIPEELTGGIPLEGMRDVHLRVAQ